MAAVSARVVAGAAVLTTTARESLSQSEGWRRSDRMGAREEFDAQKAILKVKLDGSPSE